MCGFYRSTGPLRRSIARRFPPPFGGCAAFRAELRRLRRTRRRPIGIVRAGPAADSRAVAATPSAPAARVLAADEDRGGEALDADEDPRRLPHLHLLRRD